MSVLAFSHTKQLLAEYISLSSDTFIAVLLEDNYVFNASQTSLADMISLGIKSTPASFSTTYGADGIYRAYIDPLSFSDVTGKSKDVVVFADGFKNGIDRPLLFAIGLGSHEFYNADFIMSWSTPFVQW